MSNSPQQQEKEMKKNGGPTDDKEEKGKKEEMELELADGEKNQQKNGGDGAAAGAATQEKLSGGCPMNKNWRDFVLRNPLPNVNFQYFLLALSALLAFVYTGLAIGGGFSKEWNMHRMYQCGYVYMLFLSGLMWLNILTKWLLIYLHIGRSRLTANGGKCLKALLIILILFYALTLLLLVIVYWTGILLPLIKHNDPTYERFNAPLNFLLPLLIHGIFEALFAFYWIRQGTCCFCSRPSPLVPNPYF